MWPGEAEPLPLAAIKACGCSGLDFAIVLEFPRKAAVVPPSRSCRRDSILAPPGFTLLGLLAGKIWVVPQAQDAESNLRSNVNYYNRAWHDAEFLIKSISE